MAPFRGTRNKAVVREQWDAPLIIERTTRLQRRLSYLGLPGPKIMDLRAWTDHLNYCSAVERLRKYSPEREEDLEIHRQMLQNAGLYEMDDRFELLRCDIEDLIINGGSLDGQPPAFAVRKADRLFFQYDLVNLDFLGGFGGRNKQGKARRVRAIKMLLERQCATDFLLLLTLNVRDRLEDELTEYLIGARRDATTTEVSDLLDWYAACGERMREYKLKAVVPLFMRREAEVNEFECIAHPPIFYEGDGNAHMVHFVFNLRYKPTNFHVFGAQSDEDVINLPLMTVTDECLCIADRQHPGFSQERCVSRLRFLPDALRLHLHAAAGQIPADIAT